jgi:hypothetical protein
VEEWREEADKEGGPWTAVQFPHRIGTEYARENVGWYARTLPDIPTYWMDWGLLIDAGILDDADQIFINGAQVAASGSMTGKQSAWTEERVYQIPSGQFQLGTPNLLSILIKQS